MHFKIQPIIIFPKDLTLSIVTTTIFLLEGCKVGSKIYKFINNT